MRVVFTAACPAKNANEKLPDSLRLVRPTLEYRRVEFDRFNVKRMYCPICVSHGLLLL